MASVREGRQKPVNLNSATFEEMAAIPSIGRDRAEQLMKYRPFEGWDDLKRVPGFEGGLLEELKKGAATVEPPTRAVT